MTAKYLNSYVGVDRAGAALSVLRSVPVAKPERRGLGSAQRRPRARWASVRRTEGTTIATSSATTRT
jgi:hypothetical protein